MPLIHEKQNKSEGNQSDDNFSLQANDKRVSWHFASSEESEESKESEVEQESALVQALDDLNQSYEFQTPTI